MHEGVCKGMISLSTAQRALAGNWVTAADAAGLQLIGDPSKPVEESKACLRDDPPRCTTLHEAYDDRHRDKGYAGTDGVPHGDIGPLPAGELFEELVDADQEQADGSEPPDCITESFADARPEEQSEL